MALLDIFHICYFYVGVSSHHLASLAVGAEVDILAFDNGRSLVTGLILFQLFVVLYTFLRTHINNYAVYSSNHQLCS